MVCFLTFCAFLVCVAARYMYLRSVKYKNEHLRKRKQTVQAMDHMTTVIVIGSGGHTSEMLHLTQKLDKRNYYPRIYIMSSTDTSSEAKIHNAEMCDYEIIKIPRSRNVGQSYFTSVFTTIYATIKSIPIMCKLRNSVILCNGPGTCIPICLIAFAMKFIWISDSTIIFLESICRVKTLSLSGKIMMYFADEVIVQWPYLQDKYKGSTYIGNLF